MTEWKVYEHGDVSCPICKTKKKQGCVYSPLKYWDGTPRPESSFHSEAAKKLFARVGTPMGKPHTQRKQKARLMTDREKRKFEEQKYYEQFAASKDRTEALRANARAVQDEHVQLGDWLRENAGIFEHPSTLIRLPTIEMPGDAYRRIQISEPRRGLRRMRCWRCGQGKGQVDLWRPFGTPLRDVVCCLLPDTELVPYADRTTDTGGR